MSVLEDRITAHYDTGAILARIKAGLIEAGVDPEHPRPHDLAGVDQFHSGGLKATEALLEPLAITRSTRVLDIGCGIGGTSRFVAERYGAKATGIDLTPAFVDAARALTAMVGTDPEPNFAVGSALDLPAEDASFDLAIMIHVGMNISDKTALFAEVARVLAVGGQFALFDLMRRADGEIVYPAPWAGAAETSFVDTPDVYRDAAAAADLRLVAERDRTKFAVEYFRKVVADTEANGPPPVGLALIMGDAANERYGNALQAVFGGLIGPWEMVFEKPA